jgi:hypothetical protein
MESHLVRKQPTAPAESGDARRLRQARASRKGYESEGESSGPAPVDSRKSEKDMQTSLRLPRALYEQLARAAAQNGVGIGEEIRSRVELSFEMDDADPDVRQLAEMIVWVAEHQEAIAGAWRESTFSFETFKTAINTVLSYYAPKGETGNLGPPSGSLADVLLGAEASTELSGKSLALGALETFKKHKGNE